MNALAQIERLTRNAEAIGRRISALGPASRLSDSRERKAMRRLQREAVSLHNARLGAVQRAMAAGVPTETIMKITHREAWV